METAVPTRAFLGGNTLTTVQWARTVNLNTWDAAVAKGRRGRFTTQDVNECRRRPKAAKCH